MKKHCTAHVIFAATALASGQAWALGFGRSVSDAVLGQPLTFTVPVHVEAGEQIASECLAAKVRYGETLLPPNTVHADVLPGGSDDLLRVRVTTSEPVSEPLIEVSLDVGCDRRFSRVFSVFADPPTLAATPAQVTAMPQAAAGQAPLAASPESTGAMAPGAVHAARRSGSAAAAGRPHVAHKAATTAAARERGAAPAGHPQATDNGGAGRSGAHAPSAAAASQPVESGVSRLKLEMEEPAVVPPVGASAAAAAASAAEDDAERQLKALQQGLEAARRDIQAQREQTAALQAQLAQARARADSPSAWTPWLVAMLAIAAAAIAALVWKLRQQTRIARSDWFNQSALGPATAVPPASELSFAGERAADLRKAPATSVPAEDPLPELPRVDARGTLATPAADLSATTRPFDRPPLAAAPIGGPRELSVEELLDLEQQADFFIALGQEDAAVDLLMSHLRSAGGQSPLPYTKLLEIYRRQGDRSAYERIRARFNRRFNAYAPDWEKGPAAGRSLEDYPDTVAQLERVWPTPIDAMAMLESLLFKRDDSELFDLPAYRDVLVLYSLARDLWQYAGGQGGTQVDVLLPLDDGSEATFPGLRRSAAPSFPGFDDAGNANSNGMPTSFDVTGFDAAPSIDDLDLELPPGSSVRATLDTLNLSPAPPTRAKPDPRDWLDGRETPDPESPTRP